MASSSLNSSFSLHNATPKQFDEAFEELYLQSPMPIFTKSLLLRREKCKVAPAAHVQSRVKIKAIFDTMKERNQSMCSELSSSICISNTSLCEADVDRLPINVHVHRQKENRTPSPEMEQNTVAHHAEEITETPRSSRRPGVEESPAMRAAKNFARHAALLDSLSALDASTSGRDSETEAATISLGSNRRAQRGVGGPQPCHPVNRRVNNIGITRTVDPSCLVDDEQLSDTQAVRTGRANLAKCRASEVCLPVSQDSGKVEAGGCVHNTRCLSFVPSLSATRIQESAHCSPVMFGEEAAADQETLQLVSKLVQHLQSSAKKMEEDSDCFSITAKPVSSQSKEEGAARDRQSSKTSGAIKTDFGDSDCDGQLLGSKLVSLTSKENLAGKQSSETMLRSKRLQKSTCEKASTEAASRTVKKVRSSRTAKRSTATSRNTSDSEEQHNRTSDQKQHSAASSKPLKGFTVQKNTSGRTRRTQNRHPALTERSSTAEQERKAQEASKTTTRSRRQKMFDSDNAAETVEADVITQQTARQKQNTRGLYELSLARSDDDSKQVDEAVSPDAITSAAYKSLMRREQCRVNGACLPAQATRRQEGKGDIRVHTAGKKNSNKIYKLSCWSLQPISHLKSVRIEGKLPNTDYYWLSSVIVERVSSRVLKSTNGSLYQLVGHMHVVNNRAAGFSDEFTRLFKKGFPVDWKDLVESSVARAEKNAQHLLSGTLPMPTIKDSKPGATSRSKETEQDRHSPVRMGPTRTAEQEKLTTPVLRKAKAEDASCFHTPPQQRLSTGVEDKPIIWTPQGVMSRTLGVGNMRRTKSGRCVIPPLARWAGQYLQQDDQGNFTIAFASKAAEKHFGTIAQQELLVPARLRNTPMSKRMTRVKAASPTQQHSRTAEGMAKKPAHHTGGQKNTGIKGPKGRSNASVNSGNLEVTSLEEDMMSLVHQSKARRLLNIGERKRATCYSGAAEDSDRGKTSQDSFTDRNGVSSQAACDTDTDRNFVSQKSPAKLLMKFVTVNITRLPEKSPVKFSVNKGPERKSRGQGNQNRPSHPEKSPEKFSVNKRPERKSRGQGNQNRQCHLEKSPEKFSVNKGPERKSSSQGNQNRPCSVTRTSQNSQQKTDRCRGEKNKDKSDCWGKQNIPCSDTWTSQNSQQKKDRCRGKKNKDQSDYSASKEKPQNHTKTRDRATRTCGARATCKQKGKPEIITNSESDDCGDGSDCGQTGGSVTASSFLMTFTGNRNTRQTVGATQKDMTEADIPNINTMTMRGGRLLRSRANSGIGKGAYEEFFSNDSASSDGDAKGGKKRGGRSRSGKQCGQTGKRRGTKGGAKGKAGKASASGKENLSSSAANVDDIRPWTAEDIQNICRGVDSVSSDHPEYWSQVSQFVEGRSAQECAAFFLKDDSSKAPSSRTKKPKGKAQHKADVQNDKTPLLLGKRGTLKRRRELRAILEHDSNKNRVSSGDDLFQASPFRAGKKAKVTAIDFSKTEEEVFGRNPNFFTPRVNESWQSFDNAFSHTPASTYNTPTITMGPSPWTTKDSTQKNDIDKYIFRLQKSKRLLSKSFIKKKLQAGEEKGSDITSSYPLRQFPVPESLFTISEDTASQDDDEQDYYYSEEES